MGFFDVLKKISGVGAIAAAPFTGGTSLAWLPAAFGATSAAAGALGGTRGARTTSRTSSTRRMFEEDPAYSPLKERLMQLHMDRLNVPADVSGYRATGVASTNQTYDAIRRALQNRLSASGLSGSPVAGAGEATLEASRGSSLATFLNSLPELQRKWQAEALESAGQFYRSRTPLSETVSGSGETVAPGGVASGAASGLLDALGEMFARGLFQPKGPTPKDFRLPIRMIPIPRLPGPGGTPPFIPGRL